jgi:hypothetical protein
MTKYRVTVACKGLTNEEGAAAVPDVLEELRTRPWHTNVTCDWSGGALVLTATNDYDAAGQALLDEFWDAVHACINYRNPINVNIVSVHAEA